MRWFLLPSEAYGILQSNKSLFDNEIVDVVFTPRKYDSSSDSQKNLLYKSQNHLINNKKFSEFIQENDSFKTVDLMNVKLVRNETKLKANQEIKPVKTEKLVCQGPAKSIKTDSIIKQNHKWNHPPKTIFKPFVKAIQEFDMIKNNDRVLIGLSGGKDSLSLLQAMKQYQYLCKSKNIHFEFGCVTIDPKTPSYNPSSLKKYLAELNVPYFYEEQCIMESATQIDVDSICSFCSRMKRGRIYHTARTNGYNVLALGHHLDDFSERYCLFNEIFSRKECELIIF